MGRRNDPVLVGRKNGITDLVFGLGQDGPRRIPRRHRLVIGKLRLFELGLGCHLLLEQLLGPFPGEVGGLDLPLGGDQIGSGACDGQRIVGRVKPGEHVAGAHAIADIDCPFDDLAADAEPGRRFATGPHCA